MDALDDIIKEFLIESYENLDHLDQDLLALEEVPDDRERLCRVFRSIHTIKGTSGFLAFSKLERVTHVGESLLVLLRDGKLRLNRAIADGLLAMIDAVRKIMGSIEAGNGEGDAEYLDLIANLNELQVNSVEKTVIPAQLNDAAHTNVEEVKVPGPKNEPTAIAERKRKVKSEVSVSVDHDSSALAIVAQPLPPRANQETSESASGETITEDGGKSSASNEADLHDKNHAASVSDTTVRIDVQLLDRLMNLVGELVLARNQIMQYSGSTDNAGLLTACQRLNMITSELQDGVMKTRMQPIHNIWAKLPRIVRDLSVTCNKKVQVKMDGAETELDKTILEAIRDPLTHIVRNSVDHGIESPETRIAKGKPAEGTLLLRSFHEGGQVNIEISDDGGGINLRRVKEKALSQGLITADQAASMSDRELTNLILLPGFSTAATVTNVSGRGVGMDVVKTNVEKIGGTLEIQSVEGQGTTLRITIPLTLAIIPALTVTCSGDRYAIPQNKLVELVRLDGDQVRQQIEHIHDVPVYRLRGSILPLLYLDEQLGLRPTRLANAMAGDSVVNIVVLNAEDRQFGLVVDQINDTQEIVVKPLDPQLKEISSYAGVTIMGDGAVALILDVVGVAKQAGVLFTATDRGKRQLKARNDVGLEAKQQFLLLGIGEQQRLAIPLSLVSRLEEISRSSVEFADGRQVVQYGGQIMPLIPLRESLPYSCQEETPSDRIKVVVCSKNGHGIGLIVDQILDVVESTGAIRQGSKHPGVLGSTVIQDRVTDLLDVQTLIAATEQELFESPVSTLAI